MQLLKFRYDDNIIIGTISHDDHQKALTSSPASSSQIMFRYDLMYADIGGLSGGNGLMESISLLEEIGHDVEPRCIVIKSLCMNSEQ